MSTTACRWRVGSLLEFRKILGFYYKPNKQLFYCEGTLSFIPLKIDERVSRVIFQNSSELLHLKIPQQTKTDMFKIDKGMFQERYLGVFIISLENIFEVCNRIRFS